MSRPKAKTGYFKTLIIGPDPPDLLHWIIDPTTTIETIKSGTPNPYWDAPNNSVLKLTDRGFPNSQGPSLGKIKKMIQGHPITDHKQKSRSRN